MALASKPRMLLLDEPMAGMGPEESARMVAMLRELKRELTILLVEHDMEAVFALADRITVLVYGRVIASGAPTTSAPIAQVRDAYLGEQEARPWLNPCSKLDGIETCYGLSQVLFGVSLAIAPGEMVTLMGRNGMGKTTTVRSIMGLTPARAGCHPFHGQRDSRRCLPTRSPSSASAWCRKAGRFSRTSPCARIWSRPPSTRRRGWTLDKVYELFPRLAERDGNMGNQLSGGEQQMLAIGRALMTNPRLLILDEATEGLAPLIRAEIWRCLARLKSRACRSW